jgi:hypothetical protein
MVKFLYSSSLEKHMSEYMKGVDLQNQNNQYQQAQAQIIREGEAMQLSQAEIMNKIAQMQESIKTNIASKIIPRSQTDISKKGLSKEEYNNAINTALRDKYNTTGQLLPEFPEVPIVKTKEERKKTVDEILSLYKDKPTSTELIEVLTNEIKNTALAKQQKKDLNKKLNITQLNNEVQKNFDEIKKNKKVSDALQDEILRSLNNLKPVKIIQKVKTKSPFQQELEKKVNESNLRNATNLRNIKNPTSSSQATTASSSTTTASNIQDVKQTRGVWAQEKSRFTKSENFKTLPSNIKAEIRMKSLTKKRFNEIISEFGGEGIKKKSLKRLL